jgi:hypothetical protein
MGSVAALASPAVPRLARPLPRHVRPFPDETLSSYLRRVEYANQLTGGAVKRLARATDAGFVPALGQLTGVPVSSLIRAIPDLRSAADLDTYPELRGRVSTGARRRTPCTLCAVRYDRPGAISIWARHQDLICCHHQRWLGPNEGYTTQFWIGDEPDILEAGRRHHRAVRTHGQRRASALYFDAAGIIERWFRWGIELPGPQHLRARLHQHHPDKRSADVWAAAYYPITIALLRIMLAAHQGQHQRPPLPSVVQLARERVAAEVTSGYTPSGGFDPFLHWINRPVTDCDEGAPHELLDRPLR